VQLRRIQIRKAELAGWLEKERRRAAGRIKKVTTSKLKAIADINKKGANIMGGIDTHSLKRAAHDEEKDGEQVDEARLTSIKKLRQLQQDRITPTRTPPCQPLGNLMLRNNTRNARDPGLGKLAVLPDEILITVFSELEAIDLIRMQAVSHAMYAFSRVEGQWKHEFIKRNQGRLQDWSGNWRSTYLRRFAPAQAVNQRSKRLPTDDLHINDIYSDALYVPYLSARYDANTIARSSKFADNILRVDGSKLSPADLQDKPLILSHLIDDWQALQNPRRWSLKSLAQRFPCVRFRAEAVLTTLSDYIPYHDNCATDESPLYIFDANFVEKTQSSSDEAGLGADFSVPHLFQDDLFNVLDDKRPNYRWLVGQGSSLPCPATSLPDLASSSDNRSLALSDLVRHSIAILMLHLRGMRS
jgi:hypothetical protein